MYPLTKQKQQDPPQCLWHPQPWVFDKVPSIEPQIYAEISGLLLQQLCLYCAHRKT